MPGVFMEKQRNGGKRLYRIGVVSAMWQRLELTDLVFSHIADMKTALAPFMELLPVVAGSEGEESRAVAERKPAAGGKVERGAVSAARSGCGRRGDPWL